MSACLAPVYLRGGNFSDLYRQVRTISFSEKVPEIENSPFESWPIPSRRELTPNKRCRLICSVWLPSVTVPVNPVSGSASCWSPLSMLIYLTNTVALSESGHINCPAGPPLSLYDSQNKKYFLFFLVCRLRSVTAYTQKSRTQVQVQWQTQSFKNLFV